MYRNEPVYLFHFVKVKVRLSVRDTVESRGRVKNSFMMISHRSVRSSRRLGNLLCAFAPHDTNRNRIVSVAHRWSYQDCPAEVVRVGLG